MIRDENVFPDPVYKRAVLAPLFEGAKAHFTGPVRAINRAHLVMLVECGILSKAQGKTIAAALGDIDREVDINALTYTGEYEDYFFVVEAELSRRVGPDLGGALHTARSRNDMDHTVFKLVLKAHTDRLIEQGIALAQALLAKARQEKSCLIVAYTHGQPAQPSTFGHYLSAALEVLLRDLKRVFSAREIVDLCPMGAAAITTSGFAINRKRMADLLGFAGPLENSYGCIAAVDYVSGLYSALKLLALHLGRLVQDFQFWSAFEVSQLYVPNSFVQISSIMPQKRNPVPLEHLRLLLSLTAGRCDVMINTMHNTPFTDMNDSEGEVQQAGYGAFETAGRALDLLGALIPVLKIQSERVQANLDRSCITVTELADELVRRENLSFRQAHETAAQTSRAVIGQDASLAKGYPAFVQAFETAQKRKPVLDEASYLRAVSAENFIAVRARFGGPAPSALENAFKGYANTLTEFNETTKTIRKRQDGAQAGLVHAFSKLIGA